MTITVFKSNSENNAIAKDLDTIAVYSNCVARDPMDVQNPYIIIEAASLNDANYVYIEENDRYYFITDCNKLRTGLFGLQLHVDVLQSFAPQILQQTAIIRRANGVFDAFLHDDKQKVKSYTRISAMTFKQSGTPVLLSYDTSHAILVTAG